jgi:hypothetical protein
MKKLLQQCAKTNEIEVDFYSDKNSQLYASSPPDLARSAAHAQALFIRPF